MRLSILVTGLSLLGGTLSAQAPAVRPDSGAAITMDEAIQRALAILPAMAQAQGAQRNANAGVLAAKGAFLPSLSAGGSSSTQSATRYNPSTGQIVTAPSNTS